MQENEIITMILAVAVTAYALSVLRTIDSKMFPGMLFAALALALGGWISTVFEGWFAGKLLNTLEHIFYATGSIMLTLWCWKVFTQARKVKQ